MASERQIAANRRNANKSSGPRSAAGKKRASNNAYRHGLFSKRARAAVTEEMEALARIIAGEVTGAIAFEHASVAAEAEVELGRIRDAKRALIDRTDIFGDFKTPRLFPTDPRKDPWLMSATAKGRRPQLLEAEFEKVHACRGGEAQARRPRSQPSLSGDSGIGLSANERRLLLHFPQ
jgi:hypothetical protein